MLSSLTTAVTGLRSHQIKMDAIGNNIANVNTYAYKNTQVRFEDLYYQTMEGATATLIRGGKNPLQSGMGVQVMATIVNHLQGSISSTDRESDLAIEGEGFFILNNGVQSYYTRDGSFGRDGQGYLVNANGLRVMGWMGDPGEINNSFQMSPIHIALGEDMIANATSNVSFAGNLDGKAEVGDQYVHDHYIYDSLGRRYDVEYTFTKQVGNVWEYEVAIFEHMTNNSGFLVVPKNENTAIEFIEPELPNQKLGLELKDLTVEMNNNGGFFVSAREDANLVFEVARDGDGNPVINTPLDVDVDDNNNITVTLETDGEGNIVSTYQQIRTAIVDYEEANELYILSEGLKSGGIDFDDDLAGRLASEGEMALHGRTFVEVEMKENEGFILRAREDDVTLRFVDPGPGTAANDKSIAVDGTNITVTLATNDSVHEIGSNQDDIEPDLDVLAGINVTGVDPGTLAQVGSIVIPAGGTETMTNNPGFEIENTRADDVTIRFVDPGPGTPANALDVSEDGNIITVTLATNDSRHVVESSYEDIASDLLDDDEVRALIHSIEFANGATEAQAEMPLYLHDPLYRSLDVNLQTNENGEVISTYREIRNAIENHENRTGMDAGDLFRIRHSTEPSVRNTIAQAGYFSVDGAENTENNIPLTGILEFDNYGNILTSLSDIFDVVYNPTDAAELNIGLDYERITQLASNYSVNVREQDGYASGEMFSYNVTMDGIVSGVYTNGITEDIGRLALAGFANPEGLHREGGNLFQVSANSGDPRIGYAGEGGRGSIRSSALEMSNVDLSQEFTELITSSRGFQANTRMVTTSDEILVEVLNMKR